MFQLNRLVRTPLAALAVFAISFAVLLLFMDLRPVLVDEGLILSNARHVAAGAIPHRDFYTNYGPAQIYLLAGLFEVAGPSFLAARVYDIALRAAIVSVAFRLLASRTPPLLAIGGTAVIGLWLFALGSYLYPVVPIILLSLVGSSLLLREPEPKSGHLMAAGALTGLAALFRYDVGFLLLVAHGLALVTMILWQGGTREERLRKAFWQILYYGIGTAFVFVPVAGLFLWLGAGPGFVHDIFEYAGQFYVRTRSLPLPRPGVWGWPGSAAAYLPFGAVLLVAAVLLGTRRKSASRASLEPTDQKFLLLMGLLALSMLTKGLVRILPVHMMLAIIPSTLALTFLLGRVNALPRLARAATAAVAFLAVLASSYEAALLANHFRRDPGVSFAGTLLGLDTPGSATVAAAVPTMTYARVPHSMACASQFLLRNARPGELIFSATGRHDKLFMNNLAMYFATGTRPAGHWHQFEPGMQTSAPVQMQIIGELQANKVRWITVDATWDEIREPNESAISSGVFLLDRHIAERYRPVASFGRISVWLRKGEVAKAPHLPEYCDKIRTPPPVPGGSAMPLPSAAQPSPQPIRSGQG